MELMPELGLTTTMLNERATIATGAKSLSASKGSFERRLGFTACANVDMTSVWPSGSALATYSVPTMVPAPGLFSTITEPPSCFCISCAKVREMMSVPPPGANGTTIFVTWPANSAANAPGERASRAKAVKSARAIGVQIVGMKSSLAASSCWHSLSLRQPET